MEGGKGASSPGVGLPGHNSQAEGTNTGGYKLLTKEERQSGKDKNEKGSEGRKAGSN